MSGATTYEEARAAQKLDQPLKIEGYPTSTHTPSKWLDINLESLALEEEVKITINDFKHLDFSQYENAVFITNPPYGERISEQLTRRENLSRYGRKIPCKLKTALSSSSHLMRFSPSLFGRPADKNRKLFNGKIKCYLYQYFKQA
jgi:putative N6-adenine-specific DNA methylase